MLAARMPALPYGLCAAVRSPAVGAVLEHEGGKRGCAAAPQAEVEKLYGARCSVARLGTEDITGEIVLTTILPTL